MQEKKVMPKVALGVWSWGSGIAGGDQVFGHHLSQDELKPVFDKAIENGLTLWDTAAVYGMGTSEELFGSFIKDVDRENLIISTKFTPQIAGQTKYPVQEMLNGSKERLHTEYIDIYWIHNPADVEKWTPELIPLAKSGQIKAIGVSNHNLEELKRANKILAEEGLKVSAVQNHYSLLYRASEKAGIIDYCKENDITFFAYMVLEQGALSGKYDQAHPFPDGSDRARSYNHALSQIEELVDTMKKIAEHYNASVAEIATAWAIAKGTLPIIGVSKVKHVEDAKKAAMIKLSEEEVQQMEELATRIGISTIREWEKPME